MKNQLTKDQRNRRDECIRTVKEGLKTALDVAAALMELRDDKLYLDTNETFEEFCQIVLGIERAHAYRLIGAAEVKESLPKRIADKITNERQARALVSVPEEHRVEVIKKAAENGPVTEGTIRAAAEVVLEKQMSPMGDTIRIEKTVKYENEVSKNGQPEKREKPVKELDDIGTVIPDDALPFWKRRQEIQDLLSSLTKIKSVISNAKEGNDPMFSKVSNAVLSDLSQAYTHLLEGKPYAVCTTCQGSFSLQPKGCSFCGNKGLISKWQWDTQSRKEVKDMRTKANALRK